MDEERKLTKKEKKELRKLEWQEKAKTDARNAKIKKFSIWGGVILVFVVVAFVLIQAVTAPSQPTQNIAIAPCFLKRHFRRQPKGQSDSN